MELAIDEIFSFLYLADTSAPGDHGVEFDHIVALFEEYGINQEMTLEEFKERLTK